MIAVLRGTMDPYRLPRQVVPTRYEIRLVPDLTTSVFAGVETITVTVHEPTSEILLNAAELEISEAAIEHEGGRVLDGLVQDRKSTRLNSSHGYISYAVFCLKKKKHTDTTLQR